MFQAKNLEALGRRLEYKKHPGGGWWGGEREKRTWGQGDSRAAGVGLQAIDGSGLDQWWQRGWREVEVFGGTGEKIDEYWWPERWPSQRWPL